MPPRRQLPSRHRMASFRQRVERHFPPAGAGVIRAGSSPTAINAGTPRGAGLGDAAPVKARRPEVRTNRDDSLSASASVRKGVDRIALAARPGSRPGAVGGTSGSFPSLTVISRRSVLPRIRSPSNVTCLTATTRLT